MNRASYIIIIIIIIIISRYNILWLLFLIGPTGLIIVKVRGHGNFAVFIIVCYGIFFLNA